MSCPLGDKTNCSNYILSNMCNSPINLETEVTPLKSFGGGKSGALIVLVSTGNQKAILKMYLDAYTSQNQIRNERPFREVLTLCIMSGTEGFPCLYGKGCAQLPKWELLKEFDYKGKILFALMSLASGTPLMDLRPKDLSQEQVLGISLKLLMLLQEAHEKLGDNFQHFDLHPDNIFVNLKECAPLDIVIKQKKYVIQCPQVSLIDFDLVQSEVFKGKSQFSQVPLKEHVAKLKGLVPERTISWIMAWGGIQHLTNLILFLRRDETKKITPDIRNWLVIVFTLFTAKGMDTNQIKYCENLTSCLLVNQNMFEKSTTGRSKRIRGTTGASLKTKIKRLGGTSQMIIESAKEFNFINMFTINTKIVDSYFKFEKKVNEWSGGAFPYTDTTHILLNLQTKEKMAIQLKNLINVSEISRITFDVHFYQLLPIIDVNFGEGIRLAMHGGVFLALLFGMMYYAQYKIIQSKNNFTTEGLLQYIGITPENIVKVTNHSGFLGTIIAVKFKDFAFKYNANNNVDVQLAIDFDESYTGKIIAYATRLWAKRFILEAAKVPPPPQKQEEYLRYIIQTTSNTVYLRFQFSLEGEPNICMQWLNTFKSKTDPKLAKQQLNQCRVWLNELFVGAINYLFQSFTTEKTSLLPKETVNYIFKIIKNSYPINLAYRHGVSNLYEIINLSYTVQELAEIAVKNRLEKLMAEKMGIMDFGLVADGVQKGKVSEESFYSAFTLLGKEAPKPAKRVVGITKALKSVYENREQLRFAESMLNA